MLSLTTHKAIIISIIHNNSNNSKNRLLNNNMTNTLIQRSTHNVVINHHNLRSLRLNLHITNHHHLSNTRINNTLISFNNNLLTNQRSSKITAQLSDSHLQHQPRTRSSRAVSSIWKHNLQDLALQILRCPMAWHRQAHPTTAHRLVPRDRPSISMT